MVDEMKYDLLDLEKPVQGAYIELETVSGDKAFAKVIHIASVTEEKKQFKLGRGRESDIKLGDISVSRLHALITVSSRGFLLQDNNSKFGTLLLIPPEPQRISAINGLSLQIGKTALKFSLKPNKAKKLAEEALENLEVESVK
jgi:pSer/pThr/pTyr-binding forkhead associated (FHA) protein